VTRYYDGIASARDYSYWLWANLAIVCFCVGPAVVAALGRWARDGSRDIRVVLAAAMSRDRAPAYAVGWLAAGAVVAMLAADLSGLSRSEVERIWLPFMVWLVPLTAALASRDRRGWLVAQAGWAVGIALVLRFTW